MSTTEDWQVEEEVEVNGVRMLLKATGTIEIERGPLGRFIDLAEQITAEGLTVPAEILAVLDELARPKETPG